MERHSRGLRPWSLVAVLGVGLVWACSGDAMHMAGDAAVDLGEALQDASCAKAQDGGGCEEAVGHGSVAVVCDQVARWTGDERVGDTGGPMVMQHVIAYSLIDVPTRSVQLEVCPQTAIQRNCRNIPESGLTCVSGAPPPSVSCFTERVEFVGDQAYVECGQAEAAVGTEAPTAASRGTLRIIW